MKISMTDIVEKLNERNDLFYDVLILRMYNEYQKLKFISDNAFEKDTQINFLRIYSSYNNINIRFQKYKKTNYFNNEVNQKIEKQIIMLSSCIQKFQTHNKAIVQNTINLMTKLECILNLPVTFPSAIERCLFEQLNLVQEESKEKEIKRSKTL